MNSEYIYNLIGSDPVVKLAAEEIKNYRDIKYLKVHEAKKLIRIFEEEGCYDAAELLKSVLGTLSLY